MINKIYKNIHNKYSTLFKFIFFLKYVFVIFFISIVLFLSIPYFFDFEKNDEVLKAHLLESYDLKILKYESIEYHSLPIPYLEIKNAEADFEMDYLQVNIASLKIYPRLSNFYDYKSLETNKIIFDKSRILLKDNDFKILIGYFYNLRKRLIIKNLNLEIKKKNESLINLKRINYSNFGYNRNIISGELFNKKFKISIGNDYSELNFKLLKTGLTADIIFNETKGDSIISGTFKSKFLNSKLKFNYDYDDQVLKIYDSYFRSKDLSFNNKSIITYNPFFNMNSIFIVEDINIKKLRNININQLLSFKNLIKKINTKNEINYQSKKFSKTLINNLNLSFNLAYGRLTYQKKISISGGFFTCEGEINLLEEFPILYFDCLVTINDKKKLLKEFSINYKNKNELLNLKVQGNVNILNNKINFKKISMNDDYVASKEDLIYFQQSFEDILFNKNFYGIFNIKKIKEFIMEIS